MPAALNVNREAVRVLVVAVGVREAARQMNLSQNTVLAWANRGQWLQAKAAAIQQARPALQSNAIKPADSLAATLADRKDKTDLHLSKYVVDASKRAGESNGKLDIAKQVRDVAAVKAAVWPEQKQENPSVMVNIALLGCDPG